ncbi:glutathione hydrolase 5 proenzyme isoform X2 [Pantherophis guttatus]|uniref:Glutathione hydrolase 5 proenzyme isoform X2 n=1 Tax=Pantherophis guttatus TaxID=94885 RepID=A0A6P9DFL2_PANGU|nr:glutathione hydrolase 5 proenzyme isoform X2 [Pantherophis guttatus]
MRQSRRLGCCAGLLVAAVLAGAAGLLLLFRDRPSCDPPRYWHAAVAADTRRCSEVGRDILKRGGSAIDAAIAALVCTSVLNPQSMGLGGGVIFTIYDAPTGKIEVLNARERAPQNITEGLLKKCRGGLLPGSQWIAVPGELRGYEEAHRHYGRLPWKDLFEPTIEMLSLGIRVSDVLSPFLTLLESPLKNSSSCQLLCNDQRAVLSSGEVIDWTALEKTLKAVAENGAKEFYSGRTAEKLVQDVRAEGGTLTLEDLKNYHVELMKPVNMSLDKYTIFSAPRPAAGAVLFFILNVLKGFNFTKVDLEEPNRRARVYHYIAETLKFANGQRAKLDDPNFSKIKEEVLHEMMSDAFADHIRQLIDGRGDHPTSHYDLAQLKMAPFGTSHVAVLAEDGSAVSATSTINHPFGSMVYSQQTGIILNNELADFCMKRSSKSISPGEMPPSAMTPSILLSKDGKSKLIIGGSGGPLIIPAVAQAIVNKLWFGYDLDQAIGAPILSATGSGSIQVEKQFPLNLTTALITMGHSVHTAQHVMNVVQGISQEGSCIFPYSDQRKRGEASGY